MEAPPTPPPPPPITTKQPQPPFQVQPPKESLAQRYKLIWRLLLISNLALGAYIFSRARKKDHATIQDSKKAPEISSSPIIDTTPPVLEEPSPPPPPVVKPLKVLEPIHVDQQRELFKWMLEEKRKVKPKDSKEKKRIDEEKAILKEYIRAESIPNI